MDTRFSSAIHALILISESRETMTSEMIAASVGTNASYIRKLTGSLKRAGIIGSRRGAAGFWLARDAARITLLDVWRAVEGVSDVHVFDLHQNPSDTCIVGANIKPVLSGMFREMELEVERRLGALTLADCLDAMSARTGVARRGTGDTDETGSADAGSADTDSLDGQAGMDGTTTTREGA